MVVQITFQGRQLQAPLFHGIDISIQVGDRGKHPNAFYAPYIEFEPLVAGDFIGSTLAGSPVNFKNVRINPHGNGTHTECVGHISTTGETIANTVIPEFLIAELLSVYPTKTEQGDLQITGHHFELLEPQKGIQALIIRTLPNLEDKKRRDWSGSNPPYFTADAIDFLIQHNIEHLLIDLPSVDKEQDDGKLVAHKSWWNTAHTVRRNATITEMIYVPDSIKDGLFLLNLQCLNWELDATPSRPILFPIEE